MQAIFDINHHKKKSANVIKKNMEHSDKRHGKKSDKETQSPVLKVFKDMIQREHNDPEKANLLKEKKETKKRRQYSVTKSKTDCFQQQLCDTSSSEKLVRGFQYKQSGGVNDQTINCIQNKNQSVPFQKKRRFWNENGKRSEDTFSCVSCALKKIASSEYACMACLGVIFLLSIFAAFMVVFRADPIIVAKSSNKLHSEDWKKKIEMLQRGYGDKVALDGGGADIQPWDDTIARQLSSLTGLIGNDFDDSSLREMNTLEGPLNFDSELSSVLDTEKINNGLNSERLRNFYKKLIQTDAQIQSLKKGIIDVNPLTNFKQNKYDFSERLKRSLKIRRTKSQPKLKIKKDAKDNSSDKISQSHKLNQIHPTLHPYNSTKKKHKNSKRYINGTDEPTGFIIQNQEIFVQYEPQDNLKKVPKCSHAPKDSKSHETQLKHPFYKNTQRLDNLLDLFLDKSLPKMVDPFGVDVIFKQKDYVKTHETDFNSDDAKKTKSDENVKRKENNFNNVHKQHGPVRDNKNFDLINEDLNEIITPSELRPTYDVLLSVSTIVNPGARKISKSIDNVAGRTPSLLERVPHIRKLMQLEEEDNKSLGYDFLKETDGKKTHDESDQTNDRRKRMDDYAVYEDMDIQSNPSNSNPNWNAPMPLSPDELASMIKQAAIQNLHKVQIPINTKDISSEVDSAEKDLSDTEYLENYSDNKYNKLVKMAQAYSDYGVLEGKKDSSRTGTKVIGGKEIKRKLKSFLNKRKPAKINILNRFKKRNCTAIDGIFEIRPTTEDREDNPSDFKKTLEKYVKIVNFDSNNGLLSHFHPTQTAIQTEYNSFTETVGNKPGFHRASSLKGKIDTKQHHIQNENVDTSVFFTISTRKSTTPESNDSSNIKLPMDNADIIQTIGHRSRVLMAVEDFHDNIAKEVSGNEISAINIKYANEVSTNSTVSDKTPNISTPLMLVTTVNSFNTITPGLSTSTVTFQDSSGRNSKSTVNKTIVKRDVPEDSNLIFWNDIYDDEYGVTMDPIEGAMNDKHYSKGMDFMKKSENWIHNKVKKFASNLRGKENVKTTHDHNRILRGVKYQRTNPYSNNVHSKYIKRSSKDDNDASVDKTNNFSELTVKMKKVCKEAAKAITETRNVKARQQSKEETVTTSLMQQLVRLMTDLIDFQVQQKTCVKLPPDLHEFLEWLTAPNPEQVELIDSKVGYNEKSSLDKSTEQVLDLVTSPSSEKEEIHPDRSDCLGTLYAVQDLMHQYNDMTDEDKSKMTGVREYLENQLIFLQKQLTAINNYKISNMYKDIKPDLRFRREILKTSGDRNGLSSYQDLSGQRRRFKRKFLKNFGKKHTRSTMNIYDGYPVTEIKRFTNYADRKDNNVKLKKDTDVDRKKRVSQEKRNLKDVYYKALNDAKKYTTFKTFRNAELSDGFDKVQVVKIEN